MSRGVLRGFRRRRETVGAGGGARQPAWDGGKPAQTGRGVSQVDPVSSTEPWWRRPGGLGIKDPRSWKTWQLASAAFLALLLGMAIGYGEKGSGSPQEETPQQIATSETTASTAPSAADATDTDGPPDAAPTTTTTTVAAGPDSAQTGTPAAGPARVILELPATPGPKTTDKFRVAGAEWKIGWAYDCTRGGQGAFEVKAVNGDGSPGSEAPILQQGPRGKGVTTYATSGERSLVVTTSCVWALKVTGVPG